jgi:hypothetical protein
MDHLGFKGLRVWHCEWSPVARWGGMVADDQGGAHDHQPGRSDVSARAEIRALFKTSLTPHSSLAVFDVEGHAYSGTDRNKPALSIFGELCGALT